jgi:hypothetical protein
MTTVKQHLWFATDMARAVTTYTSLIPGSAIEWMSPMGADTPSGPAGSVTLAAFTLGGQRYMAIEAGPLDLKERRGVWGERHAPPNSCFAPEADPTQSGEGATHATHVTKARKEAVLF